MDRTKHQRFDAPVAAFAAVYFTADRASERWSFRRPAAVSRLSPRRDNAARCARGSGPAAGATGPGTIGGAGADGGVAQYRPVMASTGPEEHRERARRAQQLSNRAREQAGGERAAAERSEQLMAEATDPVLADLHRRAAASHREALQHYEEAADFQQLHVEHERRAAERAGRDRGANVATDDRDHLADVRDHEADQRERRGDEREHLQDNREQVQDERERSFEQATGHSIPGSRFVQARAVLRRIEARLARDDATLHREDVRVSGDQAVIDRGSAATARSEPRPENRPSDEPGEDAR